MPGCRAVSPDDAQISIDFIVGFTIFMIAFIFVATMMSGLLINLQSRTIDYDAVAYRTSVVLVEDPGEPYNWQTLDLSIPDNRINNLLRLGLSIDRNQPEILQESKVIKFFNPVVVGCSGDRLCYPADYAQKLIFGDYPYNFWISLKEWDGSIGGPVISSYSIGDAPPGMFGTNPGKSGYIRRAVLIKKPGSASISVNSDTENEFNKIKIHMLLQKLYDITGDRRYQVDPIGEDFTFKISDFGNPTNLNPIMLYQIPPVGVPSPVDIPGDSPTIKLYIDGSEKSPLVQNLVDANSEVEIVIEKGYLTEEGINENGEIQLELEFTDNLGYENTLEFPDDPLISLETPLTPAILEVWIW